MPIVACCLWCALPQTVSVVHTVNNGGFSRPLGTTAWFMYDNNAFSESSWQPSCPVTVESHYKLLPFPPNTSQSSSCDLFCFYKWVRPTVSTNQHTICIRVLLNIHCWVRPMCLGLEPSLAKCTSLGLHKLGEVQNTNHQRRHSAARHKEQDSRQRRPWGNHHERSKSKWLYKTLQI